MAYVKECRTAARKESGMFRRLGCRPTSLVIGCQVGAAWHGTILDTQEYLALSLLHSCGKTCDVNLRLARLSGLPMDDGESCVLRHGGAGWERSNVYQSAHPRPRCEGSRIKHARQWHFFSCKLHFSFFISGRHGVHTLSF